MMDLPIKELGNAFYLISLLCIVWALVYGHARGKINLWELITSSDAKGVVRTDRRKLMEAVMFAVMTVSFYFFSVTNTLTDTYCAIYGGVGIGAAALRGREKRLQSMVAQIPGTVSTSATQTSTKTTEPAL